MVGWTIYLFAYFEFYWFFENRPGECKGMEFAVFAAGINSRRERGDELFVNRAAHSESFPPTSPGDAALLPTHKDRSTGLVVFGIMTLLLGCLSGLFVPLMLVGQMAAAKIPNAQSTNVTSIISGVVIYTVLAVTMIWLGIGSTMARRWARALLLLLVMGVFTVSNVLTYMHHDFIEIYQLMGYPKAQIDQIQKLGLLMGNRMGSIHEGCWGVE